MTHKSANLEKREGSDFVYPEPGTRPDIPNGSLWRIVGQGTRFSSSLTRHTTNSVKELFREGEVVMVCNVNLRKVETILQRPSSRVWLISFSYLLDGVIVEDVCLWSTLWYNVFEKAGP